MLEWLVWPLWVGLADTAWAVSCLCDRLGSLLQLGGYLSGRLLLVLGPAGFPEPVLVGMAEVEERVEAREASCGLGSEGTHCISTSF